MADVARGYLEANCAHCHNPQGSASNSGLDLRWEQDEPVRFGVMKRPVAAGRGSGNLEFDIKPGDPDGSVVITRMITTSTQRRMPALGTELVDPAGQSILTSWITNLPP